MHQNCTEVTMLHPFCILGSSGGPLAHIYILEICARFVRALGLGLRMSSSGYLGGPLPGLGDSRENAWGNPKVCGGPGTPEVSRGHPRRRPGQSLGAPWGPGAPQGFPRTSLGMPGGSLDCLLGIPGLGSIHKLPETPWGSLVGCWASMATPRVPPGTPLEASVGSVGARKYIAKQCLIRYFQQRRELARHLGHYGGACRALGQPSVITGDP